MSSKSAVLPVPPRDFAALVSRLREQGDRLPPLLRQVAEHMLAHTEDVAFQTTAEIRSQGRCATLDAGAFRPGHGLSGFSDLQQVFRAPFAPRIRRSSRPSGGLAGAAQRVRAEWPAPCSKDSSGQPCFVGNPAATGGSGPARGRVGPTGQADTIFLLGARRMFPVVSYLAYAFGKLGIRAVLVDQVGGMGAEQAAMARPGDA